jgi:hypothetical protein
VAFSFFSILPPPPLLAPPLAAAAIEPPPATQTAPLGMKTKLVISDFLKLFSSFF